MTRFPVASLAIALAIALAHPALATHDEGCSPGTGSGTAELAGVHVWLVPSSELFHTSWGLWLESNGIEGLQRSDAVMDETCRGHYPADTEIIVFYAL